MSFGRRSRAMRTTLKRGVGRGAGLNGKNGHGVMPPAIATRVVRYGPDPRKRKGLLSRILVGILLVLVAVALGVLLLGERPPSCSTRISTSDGPPIWLIASSKATKPSIAAPRTPETARWRRSRPPRRRRRV